MKIIEYLHQDAVSVCHRDTNPNNVMVTLVDRQESGKVDGDTDDVKVTLIDFNVSRRFREKKGGTLGDLDSPAIERVAMLTQTGAQAYSAPEIYSGNGYNEKVDIWGVGTVLYNTLFNNVPF